MTTNFSNDTNILKCIERYSRDLFYSVSFMMITVVLHRFVVQNDKQSYMETVPYAYKKIHKPGHSLP